MIIHARAPLRLGLAGGGTDVSPYCDVHGGYILNATIDRYAYTTIKTLEESKLHFVASDQQKEVTEELNHSLKLDGQLDLHKAVYNHMIEHYNDGKPVALEMRTFCDAPAGSGLGSSSTLVVAMIHAFTELLDLTLDNYTIAHLAYKVERIDCGLLGGRQDQYSATFGGFNFMEFYAEERTVVNKLRIKNEIIWELEASLILFFTGLSRSSATIISDQIKSVTCEAKALAAMHEIKQEALVMKECLLHGDFNGLVDSMRLGWTNKKLSAKTVSNPYLDNIYNVAMAAGATAGKISGAGGGGFMLFFTPTESRMSVIRALKTLEGQVSNCHFTKHAGQAWRLK